MQKLRAILLVLGLVLPTLLLHGCGCSERSLEGEADADTSTVDVRETVDGSPEPGDPVEESLVDPVVDVEPEEELLLCPTCDGETCDDWTTCLDGSPFPPRHLEPMDTALHLFGVHWADEDHTATGTVVLDITCTQVPIILSLTGCHSIHWVIEADPDVVIEHIFTSGWEEQIVSGVEDVPVERIADICGRDREIEAEIESLTGVRTTTSISTYYTTHFSLSHWCL